MDVDVERETLVRFGVPIVATLVFVVLVAVIGALFGTPADPAGTSTATPPTATPNGAAGSPAGVELTGIGAFALVGLLVLFVVAMAVLGSLITDQES